MADSLFDRLTDAKERKYELEKAQRRQQQYRSRLNELERQIIRLELDLETEQADVDKLTRMSLTNLFHTILRSKDEQLELERQQALAGALKLQEAQQERDKLKEEIFQSGVIITDNIQAEQEYKKLMNEQELALKNQPDTAAVLTVMENEIAEQTVVVRELNEAFTAGRRVLASLEPAIESLDKAINWGNWDLWANGGMVSTHIKHGHIDDAKQSIATANHQLKSFKDELADLKQNLNIHIDISSLLKFGDYWFDGLITDWIVQKRINEAQDRTSEATHQVRTVVKTLQTEYTSADSILNGMKSKRIAWLEQQQTR
jgi:tetratricopeptide (TPR) repeat protein